MRLFLSSAGLSNEKLVDAFEGLVGLSKDQIKIAFIPTAANIEPGNKDWLIEDYSNLKKQNYFVDIVDISALSKEMWLPRLEKAHVIFVGGGNTFHLMQWFKKSGLKGLLPELIKTRVYAGISAGSMLACKWNSTELDTQLYGEKPEKIDNYDSLGLVNFYIFPHFNSEEFPRVNSNEINRLAGRIQMPIYALDNDSAVIVKDDKIEVVSGGKWRKFN
jgi:dipeptidase E